MDEIKILIIDPDDDSRAFISNLLKRNKNFQVREASSGQDGLKKVHDFTPDIISCEDSLSDVSAEAIILKIRQEIKLTHTPIVVFSNQMDPMEMDKFMQAGATDYVGKSGLALMGFINNIPNLINEARAQRSKETSGALITFISAKGGTGTSSLCANLGTHLSRVMTQSSLVLVDLVLPIGSQALITGSLDQYNIVEASLEKGEDLTPGYFKSRLSEPKDWQFHLLSGSPDPGIASKLNVENIHGIIQALKKEFDYVFVDLGRSFSRISLPIIQEAEAIVVVLSNDISTVTLTKRSLDYLISQNINPERIYPILNRAVGLEGLSKAEAEKLLALPIRTTVPYMMSNLTLANNQNVPIVQKFPLDATNLVLKQVAVEISQLVIKMRSDQVIQG